MCGASRQFLLGFLNPRFFSFRLTKRDSKWCKMWVQALFECFQEHPQRRSSNLARNPAECMWTSTAAFSLFLCSSLRENHEVCNLKKVSEQKKYFNKKNIHRCVSSSVVYIWQIRRKILEMKWKILLLPISAFLTLLFVFFFSTLAHRYFQSQPLPALFRRPIFFLSLQLLLLLGFGAFLPQ